MCVWFRARHAFIAVMLAFLVSGDGVELVVDPGVEGLKDGGGGGGGQPLGDYTSSQPLAETSGVDGSSRARTVLEAKQGDWRECRVECHWTKVASGDAARPEDKPTNKPCKPKTARDTCPNSW